MKPHETAGHGRLFTMLLAGSLVSAACSGAPAAATGTATPPASNSAPAAESAVPTDLPAGGSALPTDPPGGSMAPIDPLTGDVCAPFADGAQPPATAEVTRLLEEFPETVDGQPVRDPKANPAMQVFCSGTDDGNEVVRVIAEDFGLDLRTVVLGRFGATVDSYSTLVEAVRAPGKDGDAFLMPMVAMRIAFDPASAIQGNVGGKDVLYLEANGGRRYQYVDGDTLWLFAVQTEAQAAKIISALG